MGKICPKDGIRYLFSLHDEDETKIPPPEKPTIKTRPKSPRGTRLKESSTKK